MKRVHTILCCAALLSVAGCSTVDGFVGRSLGLPVRTKTLALKQEPNELIADDGTTCVVTRGRFERVEVNEKVTCMWTAEPRRDVGAR